jgi:hypothetical protein
MNETVTIILPLPPAVLNPNGQHGHWARRAAALKKCRRLARQAVEAECIASGPWGSAEVRAVFFHKQARRRDGANFNTRLKGYFDGIVDAGLVVDDDATHWTTLPPEFHIDTKLGRVEITVTNNVESEERRKERHETDCDYEKRQSNDPLRGQP